jgi:hypothetical protein
MQSETVGERRPAARSNSSKFWHKVAARLSPWGGQQCRVDFRLLFT